ncbi:hypothetical protein [Nonomuraea salmonea]|uniref:hypothetical protein n=1 Tax=Nonomuraea salmonea TaxID=46181 RepID=UPI0031EEB0CF
MITPVQYFKIFFLDNPPKKCREKGDISVFKEWAFTRHELGRLSHWLKFQE